MGALGTLVTVILLLGASAGVHASPEKCQDLYQLTDLDVAVEPGVVVPASADAPAHCQVRGVIDGSIRFEVSMPLDDWEGRLMFLAHGGNSGQIGDTKALMKEGFAGATTNSGHDYGPQSTEFVRDHNALINFGFRAVHLATVMAKRVIAEFYGKEADYSYIQGCSGGGRSALVEALRFPDDYDGVIAGAPATGWAASIVPWGIAVSRQQNKHPLTAESLSVLASNSREKCDTLDGLKDGLISRPQSCTLEVLSLNKLLCQDGQDRGCLSAGQIETASFIYGGLKDGAGETIYNGVSPGDEDQGDWMLWITGIPGQSSAIEGLPLSAYESLGVIAQNLSHEDPAFDIAAFDPVQDQAELARRAAPVELPPPNFGPFHDSGGKLLIYQGWQDVPLRAQDTVDLLAAAAELSGGERVVERFSRTYLVPNMLHCAAGTGGWAADYVSAIVEWVEEGNAPEGLVGTNPGISNWFEATSLVQAESPDWYRAVMSATEEVSPEKKSTRLLCPYPQVAQYNGSGDIRSAENYTCVR